MTMSFTRCIALAFLCALFAFPAKADSTRTSGQYAATSGSTVPGSVILQSPDGLSAQPVNAQNPLSVSGTVTTTPSGAAQPVTAAALPLPSGAATAANQTTVIANQATQITAEQTTASNTANAAKGPTTAATISFGATCATTAAALTSNTFTQGFVLTAGVGNTGKVYVGGSGVNTTIGASGTGYPLVAGQSISYGAANSNQTYFICANATDTIAVTGN